MESGIRGDDYAHNNYKRSLVVTNTGNAITGTALGSSNSRQFTAIEAARIPDCRITYKCKERVCQTDNSSTSCYVYGQASGTTEPSEYVLGISSRFTNPATTEQYVQRRPTHRRPVEATEASTEAESAIEVGRSFKIDCKLFTCQYPEPLPQFSNEHIMLAI